MIAQNIRQIQTRMENVARLAGRNFREIKLVVVTKSQPVVKIIQAINAGALIFGENYPEETLPKILELSRYSNSISWHMIGHLQSRKVGIAAEYFGMLHSLDSVRIAEKLESALTLRDRNLPVLLEMNVSGESSKYGWEASNESRWSMLLEDIDKIQTFPHLKICGLMTMPPWNENPENSRQFFKKLRRLRDYLQRAFPKLELSDLSMGTSVDYEVAISEGATYVRIGQAIMGSR